MTNNIEKFISLAPKLAGRELVAITRYENGSRRYHGRSLSIALSFDDLDHSWWVTINAEFSRRVWLPRPPCPARPFYDDVTLTTSGFEWAYQFELEKLFDADHACVLEHGGELQVRFYCDEPMLCDGNHSAEPCQILSFVQVAKS